MATTQELITALTTSRNTIRTKLTGFGLVTATAKLEECATAVNGIADNGAVDIAVKEGETYTIPKGYHNGAGVVKGVAGGGNYTLQAKTVTPTKEQQAITPDQGYYGISGVTVKAIPDNYQDVSSVTATAADVLATKIIVGANGETISGSMVNNGAVAKTLDATTGNQSYTVPVGYHNGNGKVTVVLEEKEVTPAAASQNVVPTTGKVLSKVTVAAIPAIYADATDKTVTAAGLLEGQTAIGWDDTKKEAVTVTGTMANNGALGATLDASEGKQSYAIPAGYTSGGTVSISLEEKSATPTTSEQTLTPATGKVISKVTIAAIPAQFGDATGKTVSASDILLGATAIGWDADSEQAIAITGTMANNGALGTTLDATTDKQTYTIPAGYTSGGSVSIVLEEKSATPATSQQEIVPTAGKVLSKVTVEAIPEQFGDATDKTVTAAGLLAGQTAIGWDEENGKAVAITGAMTDNGAVSKVLDATKGNQSYTVPVGYHNGNGAVTIALEEKSATPTKAAQTVTPTTGKVLSKVTVAAIPAIYGDATGTDAVAANIIAGKKAIVDVDGTATVIEGTMSDNGAVSGTIDGLTTTSYTIPAGYTSGGTVSLTDDINEALAAI